ncbi:MAG TPA: GNAT family N-acetyltransferase [Pyrinomonadaceae bacterium]|nr:GNAT family N-acetyltransferase [Pyrinomonadaceae bacterium]
MQESVVIEQMKLSEKADVLDFLSTAFADNPRQSDGQFWDWHFPDSPYCDPENLTIWLAKVNGKIAGQLAAVPVELNADGTTVPAIWILDLIVGTDYRRRGIAKKLALASLRHSPIVLGTNTPKQHSTELLEGLGWTIFTKIPRYSKMLFPGNAIHEISSVGPIASLANIAYAPFRRSHSSSDITQVDGFDGSFDELWVEARTHWPYSISRTAKMLEWQYVRQPGKKFDILTLRKNGKLCGYVVMFFRSPNNHGVIEKAAITDICYAPEDADNTIDELLAAAISLAISRIAGRLITDVIDARLESRLKKAGFWQVRSDLQLLAHAPPEYSRLFDAANWFLTRGDSDISIFEHPNT